MREFVLLGSFALVACANGGAGDQGVRVHVEAGESGPGDDTSAEAGEAGTAGDSGNGGETSEGTGDAGCSSSSCLSGCCNAAGACVGGTDDTACGNGGLACLDCTQTSQSCVGQACGAATCTGCSGCCSAQGCQPGLSDQACGAKGSACIDCSQSGESCFDGLCGQ